MFEIFKNILEIFNQNSVAQTIGFLAVLVNIIAFVTAKDRIFLIFMAISSFVWGVHFWYLGLFSAAFVSFFDILKNIIALKYKRNIFISWFLIISYLIIWFFTFNLENIFSVIPILNAILSVIFINYLSWLKLKIWFLFILIFWFIYNYFWNSLGWMLSDAILFISGIIGILNILKQEKKKNFS